MNVEQVIETTELLTRAKLRFWVTGGWGIDALIGVQTRSHNDLEGTMDVLRAAGFEVSVDWLPGRIALDHPDGREIDVHPIVFAADGSAVLTTWVGIQFHYPPDGFTSGTVGGMEVPCITASLQRTFHTGYEPTARDLADMQSLEDSGLWTRESSDESELSGDLGLLGGEQRRVPEVCEDMTLALASSVPVLRMPTRSG